MSRHTVLLYESDPAVFAALQFALSLQGFDPCDGAAPSLRTDEAMCLVVENSYRGNGLRFLEELRTSGATSPAILLATNPTHRLRSEAAKARVVLIEKPLLGDELIEALHALTPKDRPSCAGPSRQETPDGRVIERQDD